MSIHAQSRSTCLYPYMAIPYSYLTHVCINLNYINKICYILILVLASCFNIQIYCFSLSTGGNEAVQARASLSSSGKQPKSLKHHFKGAGGVFIKISSKSTF